MTTSGVLQMVETASMIVVSLNLKFSQIFPKDKHCYYLLNLCYIIKCSPTYIQ